MSNVSLFSILFYAKLTGFLSYFDEIEHPMDFGTISANLAAHGYETMDEIRKDIELVFSNCKKFNPPGTAPWVCADVLEKVFKKEWPKAMDRKLSLNEKRGLQGLLVTLVSEDMYVQSSFPSHCPMLTLCPPTF